jgi:hypothetical protein
MMVKKAKTRAYPSPFHTLPTDTEIVTYHNPETDRHTIPDRK